MYWILSIVMRPRQQTLKSVTVGHLASRPDYSAGFGAPPAAPAPAQPPPSAWADSAHTNVAAPADAIAQEAPIADATQDVVAPPAQAFVAETPAEPAAPATEWTGEEGDGPDPLLAAWADVLPPRGPGEVPPPQDGENTPKPERKPRVSHDDPLDLPQPGD
jgi:hypothetical protein